MGQSKLKIAKKEEREARKNTVRLHLLEIKAQFVAYDEHGRATPDGTGAIDPFYVLEAEIPEELVGIIRRKFPKIEFVTIEPKEGASNAAAG